MGIKFRVMVDLEGFGAPDELAGIFLSMDSAIMCADSIREIEGLNAYIVESIED